MLIDVLLLTVLTEFCISAFCLLQIFLFIATVGRLYQIVQMDYCQSAKYGYLAVLRCQTRRRAIDKTFDMKFKKFILLRPTARHKTHNTQRSKMTTDKTELK